MLPVQQIDWIQADEGMAFNAEQERHGTVQVWDFSRVVQSDLSNFDDDGAWPTLIDEYVASRRRQAGAARESSNPSCRAPCLNDESLALPFSLRQGHKRFHPDDEQADNEATDDLANRLSSLRSGSDENLAGMDSRASQFRSKRCKLQPASHATHGRHGENLTGVRSDNRKHVKLFANV
jgi:hypothetical protein